MAGLALAGLLALAAAGCGQRPQDKPIETAAPADLHVVALAEIREMKPAFAQVDSVDAASARARIGGSITDLKVREGDSVKRGQAIAIIADDRLPLQARAEAAQAQALEAQLTQAKADLARYETLHAQGFFPTQRLEQARAEVARLDDQVRAARSQRAVTLESSAQGAVLAPVTGRVLRVPVRPGVAVMPGEEIALIGSAFVLRLALPERHAAFLRAGEQVFVERADGTRGKGRVTKVYPALADGRVEADVETEGLGGRVFGERVRVWIPGETRKAIVAPADYLVTRYGVDFARVLDAQGEAHDVVVRRGEPVDAPGMTSGVEVISGLAAGDRLVKP